MTVDSSIEGHREAFETMNRSYNEKPDRSQPANRLRKVGILFLVLSMALIVLRYFSNDNTIRYEATTETGQVTLPDGSSVTLNKNSVLSVDADFSKKSRGVLLDGEAFFEVGPGDATPFTIKTGSARMQVAQGSLNVNAYDSSSEVVVIVEAGIVRMQPTGGKAAEILPGERAVITKADKRMSIAVNEDVNYLAWKTGHLVFVENDLLSMISTLERVYRTKITVNTDAASSCIVTITLDEPSLESVMRKLQDVLDIRYSIHGNEVEITDVGC